MLQAKPFDGQIVIAIHEGADPSWVAPDGTLSSQWEQLAGLRETLDRYDARLLPQFGADRQWRLRERDVKENRLDLSRFYRLAGRDGATAEEFVRRLREQDRLDAIVDELAKHKDVVQYVYFRPHPTPASALVEPPEPTPDFSSQQGYLGPAPEGVDAFFAWQVGGALTTVP